MCRFELLAYCGASFVCLFWQTVASPLKWQTRTIALFPGADGYALGSIEGRVAIQYVSFCSPLPSSVRSTLVFGVSRVAYFLRVHTRNIDDKDQEYARVRSTTYFFLFSDSCEWLQEELFF